MSQSLSGSSLSDKEHELSVGLEGLHQLIQSSLMTSEHSQQSIPVTPQRSSPPPPHNNTAVAPLTPLANLKVLAEASSAVEERGGREEVRGGGGDDEDGGGRKMKSLSVLCKKFLSIVETNIGTGHEFSLDTMATQLGTNRRRIYDIINILEAVEMIVKQSKNVYSWSGRDGLLLTLAKLKAMATDDQELLFWFNSDAEDKENVATPTQCVARQQVVDENSQDSSIGDELVEDGSIRGGRWDKSLGILCQKFLMIFLIAPKHEVTLNKAGSVLMAEDDGSSTNSKTKVRRLYDIANVLSTLGLVKKKTFTINSHRKMPGYVWCGPSMQDIDAVPVCRRKTTVESNLTRKFRGNPLVRHRSFGCRPYLDEYEVKDSNSAPNTPCKPEVSGLLSKSGRNRLVGNKGGNSIRRSLSFGGQSSSNSVPRGGCGQSRQVGGVKTDENKLRKNQACSKEELVREVKEFEKEMTRISHRFPNVGAMFQDFLRQSSIMQSRRPLLPKPSDPLISSTPRTPSNEQPLPPTSSDLNESSIMAQDDSGLGDSLVSGSGVLIPDISSNSDERSKDIKTATTTTGGRPLLNKHGKCQQMSCNHQPTCSSSGGLFTKGTLQSPRKPAHSQSQSFFPVHDFLTLLNNQTREAESLLRDPQLVVAKQPTSFLSHILTTRQPLPRAISRPPPLQSLSVNVADVPALQSLSVNVADVPVSMCEQMATSILQGNAPSSTSYGLNIPLAQCPPLKRAKLE